MSTKRHEGGVSTGYETDGVSYWPASCYIERWGAIQDQERALDAVVAATAQAVAEARRHVEAERRRWWDAVYIDLGLDKSVAYSFNRIEGKLSPHQAEPKEQ